MPTLTVSSTTNFSGDVLAGIDLVEFTNLITGATATFSAAQFDGVQIIDNVVFDGSSAPNSIVVNGGSVDASQWSFIGFLGNDRITLNGGSGADLLIGTSRAETINGGIGDDTIRGTLGADVLNGGPGGTDTLDYSGSSAAVTVDLLANTASGGDAQSDVISNFENVIGTFAEDDLTGTNGANLIDGGGDNDRIEGLFGNDTLIAGAGKDTVLGGEGNDTFLIDFVTSGETYEGGGGVDLLRSSSFASFFSATLTGVEILEFGGGNYQIISTSVGAGGLQELIGDALNNTIQIAAGGDLDLSGLVLTNWGPGDQIDFVGGHGGDQNWTGSSGRDSMGISGGQDVLDGLGGDDVFKLGALGLLSADLTLRGGGGDDELELSQNGLADLRQVTMSEIEFLSVFSGSAQIMLKHTQLGANGVQRIEGSQQTADSLHIEGGSIDLAAVTLTRWRIDSAITLVGSAAADVIAGNRFGQETLSGLGGNDLLNGGEGGDVLRGGGGFDTMTGGDDADLFDFNSTAEIGNAAGSRDVVTDFQQGLDLIDLDGVDALTTLAGVQHFTFLGTAAHTGAGATLRFQQSGGNTLIFGDVDANGAADFTIQLNGLHGLTAADFTDLAIAAVQGTAAGDGLAGSSGSELLSGLGGNDILKGFGGADTLRGGGGFDTMTGGAAADRFDFNAVAEIGNAVNARDIVTDFQQGVDLIDLDGIDALTTAAGLQHFTWLGTAGHTGAGATLRFQQAGVNTLIFGDVDANGTGDFTIQLDGLFDLTAADFTNASIATIQGTAANDTLTGAPGGKAMLGQDGDDTIAGGTGADTIFGGNGADSMTGGLGADQFKVVAATQTGVALGTRDIIADFQQGVDKIDLSAIDANSTVAGNQAFVFLGAAPHTGAGATLRFTQAGGNTVVWGDVDADAAADFAIQLTGLFTPTAADFVL